MILMVQSADSAARLSALITGPIAKIRSKIDNESIQITANSIQIRYCVHHRAHSGQLDRNDLACKIF
jgi:hypothetical protein